MISIKTNKPTLTGDSYTDTQCINFKWPTFPGCNDIVQNPAGQTYHNPRVISYRWYRNILLKSFTYRLMLVPLFKSRDELSIIDFARCIKSCDFHLCIFTIDNFHKETTKEDRMFLLSCINWYLKGSFSYEYPFNACWEYSLGYDPRNNPSMHYSILQLRTIFK